MQSRAFNNITVDSKRGLLTKSSNNFLKIQDEVKYYLTLPPKLISLFPQLLSYKQNYTSYTIEYINCQDLSQLVINNAITLSEGQNILEKLFEILDEFHSFRQSKVLDSSKLVDFYIKKTLARISSLKENPSLRPLVDSSHIIVNGEVYKTFSVLEQDFIKSFQSLKPSKTILTAIHGDFCFSNILYSRQSQSIKLIDPRGAFIEKGIYGDRYYDYAKLLHSLHGNYDFIVRGKYKLQEIKENEFILENYSNLLTKNLFKHFSSLIVERGINLDFLYLIEASLFLSMVTLHYEDIKRQKALFITGLKLLNKFFENKNENLH